MTQRPEPEVEVKAEAQVSQAHETPRALDPRARVEGDGERGALWLVPVPIGNLEDITLRAQRLLTSVSLIACEDTRTTRQLMSLLNLTPPQLMSCHEHNEAQQVTRVLELLEQGANVALVSDAGTPAISDPGARLVSAVVEAGYPVSALPGACAATTALSASGLPTDRFLFVGFLPSKPSHRRKAMSEYVSLPYTLIFYESPHRLEAFLEDAAALFGEERRGVIARELSKRYETFRRGTLGALARSPGVNRGELVLLIEGLSEEARLEAVDLDELVVQAKALGRSPSATAKWLSKQSALTRQEAYDLLKGD